MTYLVTGGAGFIGSHLAEALLKRGRKVRVVDNLSTGTRQNLEHLKGLDGDLDLIEADLNDADAARRACAGVEIAFHLAALPSVARSVEFPITSNAANVTATIELLCAARAAGVRRIVYAASSSAYGDRFSAGRSSRERALVKRETMPPHPLSPYAVSKLAGEYLAHSYFDEYKLPSTTIRPFNVYGPGQLGSGAIHHFTVRALAGDELVIHGDGSQIRAWCFVDDVVEALLAMLEREEAVGQVFNVGNPRSVVTVFDLATRIKRLAESDSEIVFKPLHYTDVEMRIPNVDKALKLLEWEPRVDLDDGLARTIAWYRERQPVQSLAPSR